MDIERLHPLSTQSRDAINYAVDRAIVREHSEAAADMALESLKPIAAFAEELIDNSEVEEAPTRSYLLKVRRYSSEGLSLYVSARVRSTDLPRTPDNFMFVAAVGIELTEKEFKDLPHEAQQKLMWLGKTVENKDCYGVERETESLGTVTEGYENLGSVEAVEARKTQSIRKVHNINQTVEHLKDAILSDDLNPGAFAMFPALAHRAVLERLDRAEQINN